MNIINKIIGVPLGWLLRQCYWLTNNYGIALILFTFIIQCILLPFTIKQKRTQAQSTALMPEQQKLQKMYARNREKLAEEQQKLNDDAGINQFASCLPMLVQMPILFGLIEVVYRPIYYILQIPMTAITELTAIANRIPGILIDPSRLGELSLLSAIKTYPSYFSGYDSGIVDKLTSIKLTFLGIDMTAMPKLGFTTLAILPFAAGLASLVQMMFMQKLNKRAAAAIKSPAPPGGGMMLLMGPVMSTVIGFSFPMGINLYWCFRSIITLLQEFILDKIMPQEKLVVKARDEIVANRKEAKRKSKGKSSKTHKVMKEVNGVMQEVEMTQNQYNAYKVEKARLDWEKEYGIDSENNNNKNKNKKGKGAKKK